MNITLIPLLTRSPRNSVGGIEIQATLEENYEDELETTEHPVQSGAQITDHSFKRPREVTLHCGWSNSSPTAALGAIVSFITGGFASQPDYVSNIYMQLLALQENRTPFIIVASLRTYTNMLLVSLRVTRDVRTSQALLVTARCREIITVTSQTTSLPTQANQLIPASTAQTVNMGVVSVTPVESAFKWVAPQ